MTPEPRIFELHTSTPESVARAVEAARRRSARWDADLAAHRRKVAEKRRFRDDFTDPRCTDRYWEITP